MEVSRDNQLLNPGSYFLVDGETYCLNCCGIAMDKIEIEV